MPLYSFVCSRPSCGYRDDLIRSIEHRNEPHPCPRCDYIMARDQKAELVHSTDQEYQTPIYSDAAGVHPSQVGEAQKRFPHHEFAPDGRMIFRSHAQRSRVLKEIGMHDNDGYSG